VLIANKSIFLAVLVQLSVAMGALGAPVKPTRHDVPMVDGIRLATDVYLPGNGDEKYPTILILTPYGRSGGKGIAEKFVPQGYAVVSQDIRGRGQSEGSNVVIFQAGGWADKRDGRFTLEWIGKQPWSNGKVATWGGSAVGITQNMLAPEAPDLLKAQYVEVAASNLYTQCMYGGGAVRKNMIEGWLAATNMTKGNLQAFRDHPTYDEFWDTLNPEAVADRTVAPGIFLGGWYDIFCQGTINSFVTMQSKGGPRVRGNCRLIMGPWAHGTFSELTYPENSNKRPPAADFERYVNFHLKGEANGVDKDAPVHYYVMGDPETPDAPGNVWRSADSWPPAAKMTSFHFHADGALKTEAPSGEDKKEYDYDPNNPVPTMGGQNLSLDKGPRDQRKIEGRKDVLCFTTDELSEPLEVTGQIKATLYVSSDAPDTDFTVKLSDVYPDGRSMLLTDGILRARYRESFRKPEFMKPGEIYPIEVDLWSTSIIFNKGHRIRVAVSSSNFPRFDANPNTGKNYWEEGERKTAHNTVYLSSKHPSHIVFPVMESSAVTAKSE